MAQNLRKTIEAFEQEAEGCNPSVLSELLDGTQVKLIGRIDLIRVLNRNFKEAGINITVRRYNTILTDLGFDLDK